MKDLPPLREWLIGGEDHGCLPRGPDTAATPAMRYLTEIVHRKPRQWYDDIERHRSFNPVLQTYGSDVLKQAIDLGLEERVFGAAYIESTLQPGLNFPEAIQ